MTVQVRAMAAGVSDVGLQRDHNEDSYTVLQDQQLFVVADGMGGHRAGDVASQLAVESISQFFMANMGGADATWPFHFDARLSEEENRLLTSIRLANRRIVERSTRNQECHGMGTTVVGALFSPSKQTMYIGHVGDSRAYRIRDGRIEQITRDHSLVNDYLLAMPELTEEQRSELPKNVITRALGMQDHVAVDIQATDARPGDCFVLCSDGLSGMLEDEEIRVIVTTNEDITEACRELVVAANEHGGEDNITAVIVKLLADHESAHGEAPAADTIPVAGDAETPAAAATSGRVGGGT